MKLTLKTSLVATIIFAIIPFVGITFLPSDWGFPFLLLTLYILNPIFFTYIGAVIGKNIKNIKISCLIPLATFIIFLLSTRLIYGTVQPFLIVINLVVCVISILITFFMKNRKV